MSSTKTTKRIEKECGTVLNIEKPIYPDLEKSEKENTEIMREKNYQIWKKVYEDFYKIPLKYTCDENKNGGCFEIR